MSRARILLLAIAPVAAYLAGASAVANGFARLQPGIAMAMPIGAGPATARSARQDVAQALKERNGKASAAATEAFSARISPSVRAKAVQAFLAEPLSTEAIMVLGLAANGRGDSDAARAIFAAGSALSRREEVGALWLARDAAERNDIDGMLTRFDQILRTSKEARPVLLEQFAAATADPQFRKGMTELLASRPPWGNDFWQIAPNVPAAAKSIGELRLALAGRDLEFSESADVRIAYNLIGQGEFVLANRLYRAVSGTDAGQAVVMNANFTDPSRFAPVDWQTYSTGDFGSEISARNGLLYLFAEGAPGGAVARQWVSLENGKYRLRAVTRIFGMEEGDRLMAQLSCIKGGGEQRQIELIDGASEMEFTHSGPCSEMWLDIVAKPAERNPGFEAEIDRLSLDPVRN